MCAEISNFEIFNDNNPETGRWKTRCIKRELIKKINFETERDFTLRQLKFLPN